MRAKITKTSVDALEPGEIIADTEVKGFVARRLRSGVITYGLRYRANGKQRWLALGLHGAEITAEKARTSPRSASARSLTTAIQQQSAALPAPRSSGMGPIPSVPC